MADRYRFYEIDLFRFLAAMAVVIYHYTFRGFAADNLNPVEFPVLGSVFKYGYLGVDLFFIISGFVVLMTALNKDAPQFVISRVIRLYPAYWFSVTLTFIAILLYQGAQFEATFQQYLVNLTMLHKFVGVKHVDGVYWTLLVELKFYLLIFILLMIRQIHRIKLFLLTWLVASAILNFVEGFGALRFFLIPGVSGYFIAGAAFYLIRHEGIDWYKLALILGSYLLIVKSAVYGLDSTSEHYNTEYSIEVIITILSLYFVLFFLVSIRKTHFMSKPYFLYVGILTYPLYLIHQNIGFMLFNIFHESVNKYVLLFLILSLMIVIAYFIHFIIERKVSIAMKGVLTRWVDRYLPGKEIKEGV